MPDICGKISEDQIKQCNALITDGNESTLYLANRDDISGYVRDSTNPNIIRSIVMKTGKKFFKYEGSRTSLKPRFTTVKKQFGTKYKHEMDAIIFNWSSDVKLEIENLAEGLFVAIVVNKNKTTDASVEVYGTDVGLVMKDGAIRDLNSADFGANFPFGLESEEGQEETHTPASFAVLAGTPTPVYSYSATIEALDELTEVAA